MVAALMPPLYSLRLGSPVPRQEIVEPVDIVIVDTCEYIRKPGLRINIIEFGRVNERQHHCGGLTGGSKVEIAIAADSPTKTRC